jgi:hypothetical protein
LSLPRSPFLDRCAVDFVIAAKLIFRSPRSRFFHRREVDFFIAAISIFLCLTARINFFLPDGNSRLTAISIFFLCLTEKIDFFLPDGDSCLTAISIFLCLMARIGCICLTAILLWPYSRAPSRRYSFGLTAAPHHGNIPSAL